MQQPQRNNSETDAGMHGQLGDAAPIPEGGDTENGRPRRSRMRSLSNTLGDLFTRSSKRVRRESLDVEADADAEQDTGREREREHISRVDSTERDS